MNQVEKPKWIKNSQTVLVIIMIGVLVFSIIDIAPEVKGVFPLQFGGEGFPMLTLLAVIFIVIVPCLIIYFVLSLIGNKKNGK